MSLQDIVNAYDDVLVITSCAFQLFVRETMPYLVIKRINNKYHFIEKPTQWSQATIDKAKIYAIKNYTEFEKALGIQLRLFNLNANEGRIWTHEELSAMLTNKLLEKNYIEEVRIAAQTDSLQEIKNRLAILRNKLAQVQ